MYEPSRGALPVQSTDKPVTLICLSDTRLVAYSNRIRQYPAFVNCTTIDWFSEWPKDALLEVSERYLEEVNLGTGDAAVEVSQYNDQKSVVSLTACGLYS